MEQRMTGTFYGVSVGPGNPELLTLQAVRLLRQCPVLAAPQTASGQMLALDIARRALGSELDGKTILPLQFAMSRDAAVLRASHETAASAVRPFLDAGQDVAMLNLGDVSIYATFGYLQEILQAQGYATAMAAGVPSFCAVAARLNQPLTGGMDAPLTIAPGSRADEVLDAPGTKVLMKTGRQLPALLDGLHFHTLCEQDSDALALTLAAVEDRFGDLLPRMQWLNFGGGHHITRPGYDLPTLERCITETQTKYGVQVYLEPGEAWALNAGYLITTVLDTLRNGDTSLAILDLSAACHTPDVIEMPYRPPLLNAGDPGERAVTFRLGGPTCLAGDVIGDYSFDAPLTEGDRLLFGDMAIYTTCKNNTFNGMPLPPIWTMDAAGTCRELVKFGYEDFKMRVGNSKK